MKRFIQSLFFFSILIGLVCSCNKEPFLILNSGRSFFYSRSGGSESITFSTNRNWTIISSESWCKVSPSFGSVSDEKVTVTITVDNNDTYEARNCTLTIKAEDLTETIVISQEKGLGFIISPTSFELTCDAQTIEVEVQKNIQYSISISDDHKEWIKHIETKALTSDKAVFNISANTSNDNRVGVIHFIQEDGTVKSVHVVQRQRDALFISCTPKSNTLSYKKQSFQIVVRTNVAYQVSTENNWISIVSTRGLQESTVVLSIEENPSYEERIGKVVLKSDNSSLPDRYIRITQQGKPFDLSYAGTANCYIVPIRDSVFCFNAAIAGNDSTKLHYSIKDGDHAKIVWESTKSFSTDNLIKEVYFDPDSNRIIFSTMQEEGNVLIALQDKNNNILWSWHLWLTNYDPNTNYITFNNGVVLQDRYLGASSDESIGLYYEWGRKDPFSPNKYKFITPNESTGTVAYSIANPNVYMSDNNEQTHWDWNYEHTARWSSKKTIHDPCPSGWKVMDGYPLCLPTAPDDYIAEYNNFCVIYGKPICSPSTKFRTTGLLHSGGGHIQGTNEYVNVWTNYGYNTGYYIGRDINIRPDLKNYSYKVGSSGRGYGFNIRCQKE